MSIFSNKANILFCLFNQESGRITKGLSRLDLALLRENLPEGFLESFYYWAPSMGPSWHPLADLPSTPVNRPYSPSQFKDIPSLPALPNKTERTRKVA